MCCTRRMMKRLEDACRQGSILVSTAGAISARAASSIFSAYPLMRVVVSASNTVNSFYGRYYNLYRPKNNDFVVNNNDNNFSEVMRVRRG